MNKVYKIARRLFLGEDTLALSPEIREMIKAIHANQIRTFHQLFHLKIMATPKTNFGENIYFDIDGVGDILHQGMMYYLLPEEDELKFLPQVDLFLETVALLKHEGLVDFESAGAKPFPLFIMKRYGDKEIPAGGIMHVLAKTRNHLVTEKPSLSTYIERGFRNSDQYKFYREDRRDLRSWRKDMITMGISAIALVISLGTSIRGCIKRDEVTTPSIHITIPRDSLQVRIDTVRVHDTLWVPLKAN